MDALFIKLQKENEKRLSYFLDFLELGCCKYCALGGKNGEGCGRFHSNGGFMPVLLECEGITQNELDVWFNDLEHGILHGLIVGMFSTYFCKSNRRAMLDEMFRGPDSNYSNLKFETSRFLLGCLFHDFLRSSGKEPHDRLLKKLFPRFDNITYRHSTPLSEDESKPLILADRLELLRYENRDWLDPAKISKSLELYGPAETEHFYKFIRPLISKVIKYWNDTWFAHTPEYTIEEVQMGGPNFPMKHKSPDGFAVNIGGLSRHCFNHYLVGYPFKGLIPSSLVKSNGGKLDAGASVGGRDHPYINGDISLDNWIFIYRDNSIRSCDLVDYTKTTWLSLTLFERLVKVIEDLMIRIKGYCIEA